MQTIPSWAVPALRRSHGVECRVWSSVNGSGFTLPVPKGAGGTVTVDGTSAVMRKLSVPLVSQVDAPAVDPFGAELYVEYVVKVGLREAVVPAGVYVIGSAKEDGKQGRRGQVQVTGNDRWQRIIDARFESPVTTSGSVVAAIASLVAGADPRIPTLINRSGSTATHTASVWQKDRDDAITKLSAAIGCRVYFDALGRPVLAPVPQVPAAGDPGVWQIGRGNGGALIESARQVSRDATYNAVVARGEPPDGSTPVWAVARDDAGTSRSRWGGPFGKRTRYYSSPLVRTTAQAQSAARAILARVVGQAWALDLSGLPNPALEPGDPLRVEVSPGSWETHLLDGYTLPLEPAAMSYATRSTAQAVEDET